MEGMPRFTMIALEWKRPSLSPEVSGFSHGIRTYIREHFGQDPDDFSNAIKELLELREDAAKLYPSVEVACHLKRYYAQLKMLASRIPFDGSHPNLQISWSWHDCLQDPSNVVSYTDIEFEMASVMFNIACVHARIAAEQPRDSEDGIKNAFMHFGYAAYPFQCLRDEINASRFGTADFDHVFVTFFLNAVMAQAQECMVEKALIDHRNPLVIARLTSHLFEVYSKCREHLESSCLCDILSTTRFRVVHEWMRLCSVKSWTYGAISMLYLGMQAEEQEKHGERVAYYSAAAERIKNAVKMVEKEKRLEYRETVMFVLDVVTAKDTNARKENEIIYHAKVPKMAEISMADPLNMACAYSFNPTDRSISGEDLFAALLPTSVVKAVSVYEDMKDQVRRGAHQKVAAYDQEIEDELKRMRVDELSRRLQIEGRAGGGESDEEILDELPEEMLERNAFFSSHADAIPSVLDKLRKVAGRGHEVEGRLNELAARLNSEDLPASEVDEGLKAIREEIARLSQHSQQAKKTNAELQRLLADHSEQLRSLALPFQDFLQLFKSSLSLGTEGSSSERGKQLIDCLTAVQRMQRDRLELVQILEEDLKHDDISGNLLIEKSVDNTQIFNNSLKKHSDVINRININLESQNDLVAALRDANAEFAEEREEIESHSAVRRERVLGLVAAADVYTEVDKKVEEAALFYSKLETRIKQMAVAADAIAATYSTMEKKREDQPTPVEGSRTTMERFSRDLAAEESGEIDAPSMTTLARPLHSKMHTLSHSPVPAAPREVRRERGGGAYLEFFRAKMGGEAGSLTPPVPSAQPTFESPSMLPFPIPAHSAASSAAQYAPSLVNAERAPVRTPGYLTYGGAAYQPPPSHVAPLQPPAQFPQAISSTTHSMAYRNPAPTPVYSTPAPSLAYNPPPLPHVQNSTTAPPSQQPHPTSSFPFNASSQFVPCSTPIPPSAHSNPVPPTSYSTAGYPGSRMPFTAGAPIRSANFGNAPITSYEHNYSSNGLPAAPLPAAYSMPPSASRLPQQGHIPPSSSILSLLPSHSTPLPLPPCNSTAARPMPSLPSLDELSATLRGSSLTSRPAPLPFASSGSSPSPWHRGCSSGTNGPLPPPHPHPHPHTCAPLPSLQPAPGGSFLPTQPSTALDLLSGISSDLSFLPAPLQPMALPPSSVHESAVGSERGRPPTSEMPLLSAADPALPAPATRPAATVLPIQQQPPQQTTLQSPMLTMTMTATHSSLPPPNPPLNSQLPPSTTREQIHSEGATQETPLQQSPPLSSLGDPRTFSIGSADLAKLEKRLLHASIRGDTEKPRLDSSDPLNSIDAFWKAE